MPSMMVSTMARLPSCERRWTKFILLSMKKFARGVGLWGESQVSNDFPKIVDKIPDERG